MEVKNIEAVRELSDQDFDELLAKLLIALDGQDGGPQALESVADSMEILEPGYANTIRIGAKRSRIIAQWGQALGTRRRLALATKGKHTSIIWNFSSPMLRRNVKLSKYANGSLRV